MGTYANKKEQSALKSLLKKIPVFNKQGAFDNPNEKMTIMVRNEGGECVKLFLLRKDVLNEMLDYYIGAFDN